MPVERSDKTGTARMFEAACARARRLSSAAAENAKDLWRPEGQKRLERAESPEAFI